jgi:cation transport regulator ChaB
LNTGGVYLHYESINDLPKIVRNLPKPAKTLYLKAFNGAWDEFVQYGSDSYREKAAQEAAWSAVKAVYEKDADTGEWVKIGEIAGMGKSRHTLRHRKSKSGSGVDSQSRAHA